MSAVLDVPTISTLVATPRKVIQKLNNSSASSVLLMSFDKIDANLSKTIADNLNDLATTMLELMLERHDHQSLEKLAELMVPKVQPSKLLLKKAAMLARAKKTVLESSEWLTSTELAELANLSTRNPSAQPNKWKKAGKIFAIHHAGSDYYPGYALDPKNGYRPFQPLAKILDVFSSHKDSWGIAIWFTSQNSYLGAERPLDLLLTEPDQVLAAAIDEVQEIGHG